MSTNGNGNWPHARTGFALIGVPFDNLGNVVPFCVHRAGVKAAELNPQDLHARVVSLALQGVSGGTIALRTDPYGKVIHFEHTPSTG